MCCVPGMMIETMAGKSAALYGLCHDATPFTFSEDNSAVEYFGKLLVKGLLYHVDTLLKSVDFYRNYYGETPSR